MNDLKVSLFDFSSSQVIGTHSQLNEDISTFALSPNQELFATANKNFLIRIFKFPELKQHEESGDLYFE
jgi:WD40 repeat protein